MNENENSQARRFPLVSDASFVCRQPPFTGGHPELECGPCTAEAQRLSDWQHAWAQAAAELSYTIPWQDPDTTDEAGRLWALVAKWEQRAEEQP